MTNNVLNFLSSQCEGKRYTNKSDIWAAGCILYEMTCLQRTFDAKNMPALVQKIVKVSRVLNRTNEDDIFK